MVIIKRAVIFFLLSLFSIVHAGPSEQSEQDELFARLYFQKMETRYFTLHMVPRGNFVSFGLQRKDRTRSDGRLNMIYGISAMTAIATLDIVVLTEVRNYYWVRGIGLPLFWRMKTFPGWNEVLVVPSLLIIFGFSQLPGADERFWLYSTLLALSGVEDIIFQFLEPLYPRRFYPVNQTIFEEMGYPETNVGWLNTPEQPLIWLQARFLHNGIVPSIAVYRSGFLGLLLCYTF